MTARSLNAIFLACAALTSASGCKKGGGVPCPDQGTSILRTADGAFVGELSVAFEADGLTVAFLPADGRPFDGPFVIGASDYAADVPDGGRIFLPWEALADDVCGLTFSVAVGSDPSSSSAFTIACRGDVPTASATSAGGSTGGGTSCPR